MATHETYDNGVLVSSEEITIPVLQQIIDLEAHITQRRIREAILGIDNGWLADIEEQIATLREGL